MSYEQVNPSRSTNFAFVITSFNDLALRIQNPSVGSVNTGIAPFPTQKLDINVPSNKLDFGPMNMRFLVSEDLSEWIAVYKWMIDIAKTDGFDKQETAELTVMDSQNQPVVRFIYKGVFPLTLGDLQYSIVDEDVAIVADLAIEYDKFDIEIVATGEIIRYGEDR